MITSSNCIQQKLSFSLSTPRLLVLQSRNGFPAATAAVIFTMLWCKTGINHRWSTLHAELFGSMLSHGAHGWSAAVCVVCSREHAAGSKQEQGDQAARGSSQSRASSSSSRQPWWSSQRFYVCLCHGARRDREERFVKYPTNNRPIRVQKP